MGYYRNSKNEPFTGFCYKVTKNLEAFFNMGKIWVAANGKYNIKTKTILIDGEVEIHLVPLNKDEMLELKDKMLKDVNKSMEQWNAQMRHVKNRLEDNQKIKLDLLNEFRFLDKEITK